MAASEQMPVMQVLPPQLGATPARQQPWKQVSMPLHAMPSSQSAAAEHERGMVPVHC